MPNNKPPVDKQRQKLDKKLEQQGLLNYQTKGQSQQQIANKYQQAGIKVNQKWFNKNYEGQPSQPQGPQQQRPGTGWNVNLSDNTVHLAQSSIDPKTGMLSFNKNLNLYQPQPGQLGYNPNFAHHPWKVVDAYNQIKATPAGQPLPDWIASQKDAIESAYKWMEFRNGGKPTYEWKYLPAGDPGLQFLSGIQGPPEQFQNVFSNDQAVQQGQAQWNDISPEERKQLLADPNFDITKYDYRMRDQILNDPNFDWSRLPKWQKTYWNLMSSPIMQAPMALAGARVGKIFGPVGFIAGGWAGYQIGRIGGQSYNPVGGWSEQPTPAAKVMYVLNFLVDQLEMGVGQAAVNKEYKNDPEFQKFLAEHPDNAQQIIRQAAKGTFESSTFLAGFGQNIPAALDVKVTGNKQSEIKQAYNRGEIGYLDYLGQMVQAEKEKWSSSLANPFKGQRFVIGSADPIMPFADIPTGDDPYTDIEDIVYYKAKEIDRLMQQGYTLKEASYDVWTQGQSDVGGQMGDFIGQMAADPLNVLPETTNMLLGAWADATGKTVASRALHETSAPFEAARRYRTLVQAGDVPAGFNYESMGSVSRWVAGLNEKGQIKAGAFTQTGLLDAPVQRKGLINSLKEDWTALAPEARAREGASMFYNNISALLTTFDDPAEAIKFLRSVANGDMKITAEMGRKIANSPEWYTILPALKDFSGEKLDGLMASWEVAAPKRETLLKIADVLGEEPSKFIEDLAKRGTAEQDFQRVVSRLEQSKAPEARALLEAIRNGEFTAAHLADIVDAFTGEGALPWHPDQFKASVLDALGSHFDEWTSTKLGLADDPAAHSAFYRTTHLLKSAQSVLLLGGSPGYALQNGLSNMVHRAATGIYGYMTPGQMDTWLTRFGVEPARLQEGVGMGGMVETATTKGAVHTEAIDAALRPEGKDGLSKAQRFVSNIGKGMPFNKLSSWFESMEGKNGYMIAMRDMWNKTWRRGAGFSEMTPELRTHIESAGINPNTIYSLIEAGINKADIENYVYGRQTGILSRSLINDAAQKSGMTSTMAATMLDKIGVLDDLDRTLSKADTPDKVRNAFRQATEKARDWQDMQTARDLKAMAEDVKNKTQHEGMVAALDVAQQASAKFFDAWQDHYFRGGELAADIAEIPDIATRNKAYDLYYQMTSGEMRRVNARDAAVWQGIFDAWGKSDNPHARQVLTAKAQVDAAMKHAYDYMREVRRDYFNKYKNAEPGDLAARAEWFDGQTKIDAEFQRAFDSKASAERAQGDAMGRLYEEMYGPAAGEAARKWYADYTKFSADIVQRERKFRASLAGMDKDARNAAKQKYYSTDKVAQIAELETINKEGIKRLQDVIKRGGGQEGQGGVPTDPNAPKGPTPFDDINQLLAEAEQRNTAETQQKAEQVKSVWDIAEEYARVGLPYDHRILQDKFALLNALRKEEYGGIPDLKGLDDPRLTPERVREVMERRSVAKAAQETAQVQRAMVNAQEAASNIPAPKINNDTNILRAIREHGGLSYDLARDLTGEQRPRTMPGVFKKKGIGIDEMARMLADDGYPIDLNAIDDPGGIRQTTDLLNAARSGDKIYPIGHDHEAAIARAEFAAAEQAFAESMQPEPFDPQRWQAGLDRAVRDGDLTTMYEYMGALPEEMGNQPAPTGETWNDYMSRIADETAARVEKEAQDLSVAEQMVRNDVAQETMNTHADAVMTRRLLEERFKTVFDLTDEQAAAYMELSDSIVTWYERKTRENGDAFYSKYYRDVVKGGEGDLYQLQPVNRRMNQPEIEGYARALNRGGEAELRRAIRNEGNQADRVAILNEVHKLNPALAEKVAKQNLDILLQTAYHGSPHKFDKFTLDRIGTGEGAQVYGWGLYFAGEKKVAEYYRTGLSVKTMTVDGKSFEPHNYSITEIVGSNGTDYAKTRTELQSYVNRDAGNPNPYSHVEDAQAIIDAIDNGTFKAENEGQTYAVNIPDEGYLMWDRPLNDQPPKVQEALRSIGFYTDENVQRQVVGGRYYKELADLRFGGDRKAASLALKDAGINGIQYLDQGSRGAGEGTYNYVVFDDNAVQILDTYHQATGGSTAKGAVIFDADGIKATIHAFEAKDFSTLVHENAHVFRRMLADVAARTDNPEIKADLDALEKWAGAKDGVWDRAAEEKFARGFEKYITDGKAPTPRLQRAFESFKNWMLQVYGNVTGSAIDVNLTDNVRAVFDRLIGDEEARQTEIQRRLIQEGDQRQPAYEQLRKTWDTLDEASQSEAMDWILNETLVDPLSGLETLVAKGISREKPPGWVEGTSDLNALKAINDTWGHGAGDEIIAGIGKIAKQEVQKAGGRAFRVGGDEFTYWFPDVDAAKTALDAIDRRVYKQVFNVGGEDRTGFSVAYGVGETADLADKALYADKLKRVESGQRSEIRDQMPDSVVRVADKLKEVKEGISDPNNPNIMFQQADKPFGTMDEAGGFKADSEWMDQGWQQHVQPLLDSMQDVALERLNNDRPLSGAMKDISPEGQKMLRKYINGVQNDMGAVKLSTMKWGESQRDFAMLNYNRRYGFDRRMEAWMPYEFFYTRSLMTWAMRGLDKPSWYANYARIRNMQNKHERDIPERLRNKFKIEAPWLPKWMGDALYIDPIQNLFTPANFQRPFETMMRDTNYQQIEAERILQEWAQDGTVSQEEIQQAVQTRTGTTWERALAEAGIRREGEISNPFDFMATMFGPAWYLSTPLNMLGVEVPGISKGDPNKVTTTPLLNTTRAVETVTKGTWAEPIGQFVGLVGKPEQWLRDKAKLPEFGEYGDYYIDRQLANMVADGQITSQQAQQAMIERQGPTFDQAKERVRMELALRTPLAGTLYAGTHEGTGAAAQAFIPSLFGSGLLPAGELEYRGLKTEWNAAWKMYDAGDKTAINQFFDDHPEYEAYLAKGKPPEERLRSFMVGSIWDAYMALGETDKKTARAQMGEDFQRAFLNKETRSYDTLTVDQLTQWSRMLGALTPRTEQTAPTLDNPNVPQINYYSPEVTQITDQFFQQRREKFNDYYMLEQGYYSLPKSERTKYLLKFPQLKKYWDWKKGYYDNYPELKPIFNGKAFKTVDTSTWAPGLEQFVVMYAMTGEPLPKGASASLEQVWVREGRPYGDMQTWLDAQVAPAMLYQQGTQ